MGICLVWIRRKCTAFPISTFINGSWGASHQFLPSCPTDHPNSCLSYLLTWILPNFPSNYRTILKYWSLICYLLTWLLPNLPSDQPSTKAHVINSCLLFLFSFSISSFLFNKVACKGYFCTSIINNTFIWRLFISHGKRKVYTNCWPDIILLKISSGQFFKTWNQRIFKGLKSQKSTTS
jgi:hypothetical protein